MTMRQQIDSFYEFAVSRIEGGCAGLSMDEIYSWWRATHLTDSELAESVAAVRAAYAEMEAGEKGRPAREVLREACERWGLTIGDD